MKYLSCGRVYISIKIINFTFKKIILFQLKYNAFNLKLIHCLSFINMLYLIVKNFSLNLN